MIDFHFLILKKLLSKEFQYFIIFDLDFLENQIKFNGNNLSVYLIK